MKPYLSLLFVFLTGFSFAQSDQYWIFGRKASTSTPITFDFTSSPASINFINNNAPNDITPADNVYLGFEGSAVATTETGQLLFYTDGDRVYDGGHNLIGSGLGGNSSCTQPAVICLNPICPYDEFLVFSNPTGQEGGNIQSGPIVYRTYSVSSGTFTPALNQPPNQLPGGSVTANEGLLLIPGDAGVFWLLHQVAGSSTIRVHKIDDTGIVFHQDLTTSFIGNNSLVSLAYTDVSTRNPLYSEVAVSGHLGTPSVFTFLFDKSNGTIIPDGGSNIYTVVNNVGGDEYDVEFSPDGSKLYFSAYVGSGFWQHDFSNGVNTNFFTPSTQTYGLKNGKDGKLYLIENVTNVSLSPSNATVTTIGVIDNPNALYSDPNFGHNQGVYSLQGVMGFNFSETTVVPSFFNTIEYDSICPGDSLTLFSTIPDSISDSYTWNTGENTSSIIITEPGQYWVQSNQNGCIKTDSIFIHSSLSWVSELDDDTTLCGGQILEIEASLSNGTSYQWNTGENTSSISVSETGQYIVTAQNEFCSVNDTINVTFSPIPIVNIGNDTTLCVPDSLILGIENNYDSINWMNNCFDSDTLINSSGDYWVNVSLNGCSNADTISVNFIDLNFSLPNDTIACLNDEFSLNLTTGMTEATHIWNTGETSSSINVSQNGEYWVTAQYESCIHSDTMTIEFSEPSSVQFTVDTLYGCEPLTVNFTPIYSTTPTNCLWSFGDGNNSSECNEIAYTYSQTGCFLPSLEIQDEFGCSFVVVSSDSICIVPNPNAQFTTNSFWHDEVQIFVNNQSTNATSYEWLISDSFYSNEFNPNITLPSNSENIPIILVAQNELGCSDTAQILIEFQEDIYVYVPNTFTPNGDEFNNVLKVITNVESIPGFKLEVYNRWGELIFESYDVTIGWDGTYKGKKCQDGTYVWKIHYGTALSGEKTELNGHISILR